MGASMVIGAALSVVMCTYVSCCYGCFSLYNLVNRMRPLRTQVAPVGVVVLDRVYADGRQDFDSL